jgi:hypothetical protein
MTMIRLLTDLPDDVVGFEAIGEVEASDYTTVLDPAIDEALARHERIRLLYVLGEEFTGYSGAAMWEDAVVGTRDFSRCERIAVVSDTEWVRHGVNAFAWFVPSRIKTFGLGERAQARAWVSER